MSLFHPPTAEERLRSDIRTLVSRLERIGGYRATCAEAVCLARHIRDALEATDDQYLRIKIVAEQLRMSHHYCGSYTDAITDGGDLIGALDGILVLDMVVQLHREARYLL